MSTKLNWQAMTARERDELVRHHILPMLSIARQFTTTWNAAELVIKAMLAKGFSVGITVGPNKQWCCQMTDRAIFPNHQTVFENTMEEAVSRCALLAVGVEVE